MRFLKKTVPGFLRIYQFPLRLLLYSPLVFSYSLSPVIADSVSTANFNATPEMSTDGFYLLKWANISSGEKGEYLIEESISPSFIEPVVVYRGPDTATSISGKRDGVYYYRLSVYKSDKPVHTSKTITVEVSHHSLDRALRFMAVGAVVFLATSFMILAGHLKYLKIKGRGNESCE